MSKQSRLENVAISKRDSLIIKNEYSEIEGKEYNETHKDALSDGDVIGKGNGVSMGYAIPETDSFYISNEGVRVQKINYSTIVTHENGENTIGGEYDRNGNPSIKKSGRNGLMNINKFSPDNEYGEDSVDTTENILLGQYKN
jgi:hypothetical protein